MKATAMLARFGAPALVAGAAVNMVVLTVLPNQSQPVNLHPGGDLSTVVSYDQPSTSRRYALYALLGERSPGATLFVPPGTEIDSYVAQGIGDILTVEDATPFVVAADVLSGTEGVFETASGIEVSFLLLDSNPGDDLRLTVDDDRYVIGPLEAFEESSG